MKKNKILIILSVIAIIWGIAMIYFFKERIQLEREKEQYVFKICRW